MSGLESEAAGDLMPRPRAKPRRTPTLRERDGALCVSFANIESDQRQTPGDYAELLLWLEGHEALSTAESKHYRALAEQTPEAAVAAHVLAEELWTLLSSIFNQLADRQRLSPEIVKAFNVHLLETVPRQCLTHAPAGLHLDWAPGREDDLSRPLWSVILSASRILTSKYRAKVKRCVGEECDLLFIGNNSGSQRKWCSMKACGKRVKTKRHYHQTVKPRRMETQAAAETEFRKQREEYRRSLREEPMPNEEPES